MKLLYKVGRMYTVLNLGNRGSGKILCVVPPEKNTILNLTICSVYSVSFLKN